MNKHDLLKFVDDVLLDRLFRFCYVRTNDSYEAEELCSDVVYALMKTAHTDGEIKNANSFIWKIAHNVYADFSEKRKKRSDILYIQDVEEPIYEPEETVSDDTKDLLTAVYRRIAFLTAAYREAMIGFYLDGLSTAEIAQRQGTSEVTIRQRLFSARKRIKYEVTEMTATNNKPIALERINYCLSGSGNPNWSDPRKVCFRRMFSRHILWLCRKKPMSAAEIAEELNVPTLYVEEELEILRNGENGKYGLLRRFENGKYGINIILFDRKTIQTLHAIYTEHLPRVADVIRTYIDTNHDALFTFPYRNHCVDPNLVLWQHVYNFGWALSESVTKHLKDQHFTDIPQTKRPFNVFGNEDFGYGDGCGWDGFNAENICGFSKVHFDNVYNHHIKKHFDCGENASTNPQLQLALRAIDGLALSTLPEKEREHAAKAIECGYLYRDGDILYTKILVARLADRDRLYALSKALQNGYFDAEVAEIAAKLATLIRQSVPEYLLGEWEFANILAADPILSGILDMLIEKGILTPPENGIGAEGCWVFVEE